MGQNPTLLANEYGQPIGPLVPGWTPRPWPAPTELAGKHVRLVPLSQAHTHELFEATRDPATWTYLFVGPFDDEADGAAAVQQLIDDPSLVPLAILNATTGQTLGAASYMRIEPEMGCLEVGWVLFGNRLTRTTGATEAMYLMARHAFEDLGYRRYEWKCDALNAASRAAAARFGFTFEGIFRQNVIYKGRSRDTAWYAMTDADWHRLAPVYRHWLADPTTAGRLSHLTQAALNPSD